MATTAANCDFGWKAPDFRLPATDGKSYGLADIRGANGTLVMFICNHCPYVRGVIDRIVRDAAALDAVGVRSVAISANDAVAYPDDSFAKMALFAAENRLPFPYLYDESQETARAYGAVCTPDFFGFNGALELQYRGRLDSSGRNPVPGARRELFEAMSLVARTGEGPREQTPSIGCSIKWKAD
ncbi:MULTISPECIES: thioredoxin family protein [Rhodomicrobium]|uniref:thioredoxin family protein n=1 Tax=Rhodomicrobium TaxID=1068 RepID=UPI000B4B975D|nr:MULTISPECIES: thioredoxin family protein [Rhodomicrobium]